MSENDSEGPVGKQRTNVGDYDPASPLRFKVAPNIVEDLGLNLYTTLPRVLAEFVANAYDADSESANVTIDIEGIAEARRKMRDAYNAEVKRAEAEGWLPTVEPLGSRTLPANLAITVEDDGCGMSREDLSGKFLVAGRRRRAHDGDSSRTAKGRLIMGRKGLGKLAGFGVAKRVEVVSRKVGEAHATKITLAFDDLVKRRHTDEVEINETRLEDGAGFAVSGTRIILSELMHDPTRSRKETISSELAEHFEMIRADDFSVTLNGTAVEPLVRDFAYAWPQPDVDRSKLIDADFPGEDGKVVGYRYRMRFTQPNKALPGQRRGVRVYARGRLASAPSLLDANTNMHGFRMTDYLDGVVEADFLDSGRTDFISTDRQSLRWESPVLAPLREALSSEIKEACKQYQKERDGITPGLVRKDEFTLGTVASFGLDGRDRTLAMKIATTLAGACKQGVDDPLYKTKLPQILGGIGKGNLLAAIASLAEEEHPDLNRVAARVVELAHEEIDSFVSIAKGRVNSIRALKKIVEDQDFSKKKEEGKVQALLESAPWMVDSTYGRTISANEALATLFQRLAKSLGIGSHAATAAADDEERPDLVFLLGNSAGGRLVIVELKAANVPLESKHLDQLMDYMKQAEDWLAQNASGQHFVIHGHLIGMLDHKSRARGQNALRARIKEAGPDAKWTVRSFVDVLNETQNAHAEMLDTIASAERRHATMPDE